MERARVTARGLRLRASPGKGAIRKVLRRGTGLEILERETWLRVRAVGDVGWVRSDFVEPEPRTRAVPPGAEIDIGPYENDRFVGDPIRVDADFVPSLDLLSDFASRCDVEIWITSSFRKPDEPVAGAVVTPAKRSNHLVGHAIDMNLRCEGELFTSRKLRKANHAELPKRVRDFLGLVRDDPTLRWGGDFPKEDPVHIDDGLNLRDPDGWRRKFEALEEV